MKEINERKPARKSIPAPFEDECGPDLAAVILAYRLNLALPVARWIAENAGLGVIRAD